MAARNIENFADRAAIKAVPGRASKPAHIARKAGYRHERIAAGKSKAECHRGEEGCRLYTAEYEPAPQHVRKEKSDSQQQGFEKTVVPLLTNADRKPLEKYREEYGQQHANKVSNTIREYQPTSHDGQNEGQRRHEMVAENVDQRLRGEGKSAKGADTFGFRVHRVTSFCQ